MEIPGKGHFGSSPRVRGKHDGDEDLHGVGGLIPARAGKTVDLQGATPARPAHPRACGENLGDLIDRAATVGSSPRVRGKRREGKNGAGAGRLIPARAGKTASAHAGGTAYRAHPRACGENVAALGAMGKAAGSSPRVRGKPRLGHVPRDQPRLIPARAGKTVRRRPSSPRPAAHPRACGEN